LSTIDWQVMELQTWPMWANYTFLSKTQPALQVWRSFEKQFTV